MTTRKARARRTEQLVTVELRTLFPFAHQVSSAASGRDVLETPGIAVEIKARRGLDLPGWLRHARRNAGPDLPILVVRPDGMGETTVADWPATLRLEDLIALLGEAGYGTPPDEPR